MFTIYTDGSCLGNPGCGGWCIVICTKAKDPREGLTLVNHKFGYEQNTTNNRMELEALIQALSYAPETPLTIYADSNYAVQGLTTWSKHWNLETGLNAAGKPILNMDKWRTLVSLYNPAIHTLKWVKAHATCKWNNMADEIANSAATQLQNLLRAKGEF